MNSCVAARPISKSELTLTQTQIQAIPTCILQKLYSLDCCQKGTIQETKEQKMDTIEEKQKDYFARRINDIFYDKENKLCRQFGLYGDHSPDTFEELYDRITKGQFVIADDKKTMDSYPYGLGYVEWRDPSIKKDQAGYNIAFKALETAKRNAKDLVMAKDADGQLAATQAFEAWTYIAPTTAVAS